MSIIKATLLKWWHLFIYKPGTKNLYWEKIITSIAVILGFGIWMYFTQIKVNKLEAERDAHARYTIGFTTDYHNNIKGLTVVDYYYYFFGKKYSADGETHAIIINGIMGPSGKGGRYYVLLSSIHPANAEIFFGYPVPDGIKSAPEDGWEFIPGNEHLSPNEMRRHGE